MLDKLPFPVPARLPRKIARCPILEAVLEVRFVPARPWAHFPGLFAEKFGAKFPKEVDTGVSQIPEIFREKDPSLIHSPYRRMEGEAFTLQFGPRVINLVTKQNLYPGWGNFWPAMKEVLDGVQSLGVVKETVRLGLRYVNFFPGDVFGELSLVLSVNGTPLLLPETGINTVFHQKPFRHFVQINNASVIAGFDKKVQFGSIVDIDTTFETHAEDIFAKAQDYFDQSHLAEKSVFFGLLKPSFIDSLGPEYNP